MFSPPFIDLPPTGAFQTEHNQRLTASDYTTEGDEYLFNTKDYHRLYTFIGDMAQQDIDRQIQRRFSQLMLHFRKGWEKGKGAFGGISQKEVHKTAGFLAAIISSTNPEKTSVSFTPEATVFFTAIYPNTNAYLEIHFAIGEEPEAVVNIYQNGKPVMAYGGDVAKAIFQFLSFLSKK